MINKLAAIKIVCFEYIPWYWKGKCAPSIFASTLNFATTDELLISLRYLPRWEVERHTMGKFDLPSIFPSYEFL